MGTEFQRNAFKHAIAAGKLQIGLWSSLCSNIAAEIISDSGFDWILLDTEHSPNEIPDLVSQLQAVQAIYDTMKALRQGTKPGELKNVATSALMNTLTRAAAYDEATKNYL